MYPPVTRISVSNSHTYQIESGHLGTLQKILLEVRPGWQVVLRSVSPYSLPPYLLLCRLFSLNSHPFSAGNYGAAGPRSVKGEPTTPGKAAWSISWAQGSTAHSSFPFLPVTPPPSLCCPHPTQTSPSSFCSVKGTDLRKSEQTPKHTHLLKFHLKSCFTYPNKAAAWLQTASHPV